MSTATIICAAFGAMWVTLFFVGYINRNKDDRYEALMNASVAGLFTYVFCLIGFGVIE